MLKGYFNSIKAINLFVLIIIYVETKYLPQFNYYDVGSPSTSTGQTGLQAGGCTYNNGTINNSTVIELGNCGGNLYFIQLQIGSNNQTFNFQFDTGSNILWVPLKNSTSPGFISNQSSSFNMTNQTYNISYADGSGVSGNLGSDVIRVGKTNISTTGLILFANNVSGMGFPSTVLGLVGMGYTLTMNFLDQAFQNNQISTNIFSLQLRGNNATSLMYYNNGLPPLISQNTYWIQQYGNTYWQVQVIGFFAGNIQFTSQASDGAIIDSGTSTFLLNADLYYAVINQFFSGVGCFQDNSSNVFCPCNSTTAWPTLSFMFIGVQVFIPGSTYQFPLGNGTCQVNFQSLDDVGSILLGDIFFRQYVVSFDKFDGLVGFYGNTRQIFIYDSQTFLVSQYVLCAFMAGLALLGLGLWLYSRNNLDEQLIQKSLGVQLY